MVHKMILYEEIPLGVNIGALIKEGSLSSTGKKQKTKDHKIYKLAHSMKKNLRVDYSGKKQQHTHKKNRSEWAERGSKGSL